MGIELASGSVKPSSEPKEVKGTDDGCNASCEVIKDSW